MNMFITKKNSKRSQVWAKFLELRSEGRSPVLMDSAGGRSLLCVPAAKQVPVGTAVERGLWVGVLPYDGDSAWKYCEEVYEFFVVEEDVCEGGGVDTSQAAIRAARPSLTSLSSVHPSLSQVPPLQNFSLTGFTPSLSFEQYEQKIKAIHQYLRDGESYQVNFTFPFDGDFEGDPFDLYMTLFAANPSAMCFYMEGLGCDGSEVLVSNSPERLFSLKDGLLRAEPIKGTLPVDQDPKFLLKDEKSFAELTMIVDLLRNDLGKVAKVGSVRVPEHQVLMKLAHVWHTYSIVEADLAEGKTALDALQAVFPGGSITGCPKIRTMEIIDRLEGYSRGLYCGSAGYIDAAGNADFNILIRSATIKNGRLRFPVGGGIVMDSDAQMEWQEAFAKASVLQQLADTA